MTTVESANGSMTNFDPNKIEEPVDFFEQALEDFKQAIEASQLPLKNQIMACLLNRDNVTRDNLIRKLDSSRDFTSIFDQIGEAWKMFSETGDTKYVPKLIFGQAARPVSTVPRPNRGKAGYDDGLPRSTRSEFYPWLFKAMGTLYPEVVSVRGIQQRMRDMMEKAGAIKEGDIAELASGKRYIKSTDHMPRTLAEKGLAFRGQDGGYALTESGYKQYLQQLQTEEAGGKFEAPDLPGSNDEDEDDGDELIDPRGEPDNVEPATQATTPAQTSPPAPASPPAASSTVADSFGTPPSAPVAPPAPTNS